MWYYSDNPVSEEWKQVLLWTTCTCIYIAQIHSQWQYLFNGAKVLIYIGFYLQHQAVAVHSPQKVHKYMSLFMSLYLNVSLSSLLESIQSPDWTKSWSILRKNVNWKQFWNVQGMIPDILSWFYVTYIVCSKPFRHARTYFWQ